MEKKMKISRLKQTARQKLAGNYAISAGALVISYLVQMLISMALILPLEAAVLVGIGLKEVPGEAVLLAAVLLILILTLAVTAAAAVFQAGLLRFFYNLCTEQPFGMGDLLYGFKNRPWRFAGLQLIFLAVSLAVSIPYIAASTAFSLAPWAVWLKGPRIAFLLLSIVLGTLLWLFCGQTFLVLAEDREARLFQAIGRSVRLMEGNKRRLFVLMLSFAGMIALSYLSLGIGFLWTGPYMYCTLIYFYLDLKREKRQDSCIY